MAEILIDDGMILLEPRALLDKAIIGREGDCLVYSYEILIEAYMSEGATYEDAVDHIEFNIIGFYMEGWPIIKDDIHEDSIDGEE